MPEDKPLFEVEAQPPTPEATERQRVREEYRAKLAEKLKDPEFRKIEGFPSGSDEAILALSDPPYYTACPNPFIEEWLNEHGKPFDSETDDYRREPFAADVSEGKNHPIYNAHSYHTKVPHRAIMRYILHYTEPGDVVYDGFCGTGMTGVAAQLCGDPTEVEALGYKVDGNGSIWEKEPWEAKQALDRGLPNPHVHLSEPRPFSSVGARKAVLGDLSPAATFFSHNYNAGFDATTLQDQARQLLDSVESQCGWMYTTLHREPNKWTDEEWSAIVIQCANGIAATKSEDEAKEYVESLGSSATRGNTSYVVWSDVLTCPNCSGEIIFWDAAVEEHLAKVRDKFSCTHCNAQLTKPKCKRKTVLRFDDLLGTTISQAVQVPIAVNYTVGTKRKEKRADSFDLALIARIDRLPSPSWFPSDAMPIGMNTAQPRTSHGLSHVHHFYTRRNLLSLSRMLESNISLLKALTLNGLTRSCSKLVAYNFKRGGNKPRAGTLYVSSIPVEARPTRAIQSKLDDVLKALSPMPLRASISTQSASAFRFRDSIDYVFTDPPFGANINYSEMSFIWESALRCHTNTAEEAIESKSQSKSLADYQDLLCECLTSAYISLKPGRWASVEFHSSSNAVWNSVHEALNKAGFVISDARIFDKGHYSIMQYSASAATDKDLVITCYKPTSTFLQVFERDKGTPEGAQEFLEQHMEMLPVAPTTKSGQLESLAERTLSVLYDRMIAYHLVKGARIPLSAVEFRAVLDEMCYERDGMYFLPGQVVRYDALKSRGIEVEQLSIFVRDEKSAVQWVRNELEQEPHTLGELTPKFMQASQDWGQHEVMPELRDLLQQYFIREGDETWVVPDPDNEKHLEEVRRNAMLREFMEYVRRPGQLKLFRTEAVLAGFAHCWETKQYDVIVGVCEKIPPKTLQEIQDLVMFYDIAKERVPEKITQFEFKWE